MIRVLIAFYALYKKEQPDARYWNFDDFINWLMIKFSPSELEELEKGYSQ